jgi:hypothetical protein
MVLKSTLLLVLGGIAIHRQLWQRPRLIVSFKGRSSKALPHACSSDRSEVDSIL